MKTLVMERSRIATISTARIQSKRRTAEAKKDYPFWLMFSLLFLMCFVICIAVNLRAQEELKEETERHKILSEKAEVLRQENQQIQEEIRKLKTDPSTIEREARKLGMSKPNEKIFVSED